MAESKTAEELPLFHIFTNFGDGVRFRVRADNKHEASDQARSQLQKGEFILGVEFIPSSRPN